MKKILLTLFLLALASPAFAAEPFLTDAQIKPHRVAIGKVEKYLSGLSTVVADFTQVAPDGSLAAGKFFMKRPGKMRWQYLPPTPVLMIANGSEFIYFDYELGQVSYIPLDSALVGFLAQPEIRFEGKVALTNIERKTGAIRLSVVQRDKPDEGKLTLEFSEKPLVLRNMIVRDAGGQETTVALNNAQFGAKLEDEIFVFRDPRGRRQAAPLTRTAPPMPEVGGKE